VVQVEKGTTGLAREHIEAPPEEVYDLVADVTRMGEWSPECQQGEWLNGATGPAVGASFKGKNRHGRARWSTSPRVVVADRGHEFAFVVPDSSGRDTVRWTYRFEATDSGTDVTESYEVLRDLPKLFLLSFRWVMGVKDRPADLEVNMQKTLGRLKTAVEGAVARGE
jgi:Polyketide cyclase / dehydrase and lipid transport